MNDPNAIAGAIENGGISDYDGALYVKFNGAPTEYKYSIDENFIQFPMWTYVLTDWLRGLGGDKLWSVYWANK